VRRKTLIGLMMVLGLLFGLTGGGAVGQGIGPQESAGPQAAVGTAFTYQGRLLDNGSAVNGTCDLRFGLYDYGLSPTLMEGPVDVPGVVVGDGYFSAAVDFGTDAFTGEARQMEIAVRCPSGSGSYSTLGGMVPLTAAPYAHSLRPGATIASDTAGELGSVLHVEDSYTGLFLSAAVEGQSTQGTGVRGESASGHGVHGEATAATGATYGVYGKSNSSDDGSYGGYFVGYGGVFGRGTGSFGPGVKGTSTDEAGGYFTSTNDVGVFARSENSWGVYGYAAGNSGQTYGVYGRNDSSAGRGVYGYASPSSGTTYGVYGEAESPSGHGVFGTSPSTDYQVAGVTGSNTGGGAGAGVYGYSLGGYGVHGRATSGTGVYGSGSTTGTVGLATGSGTTYGVYGRATSLSGRGLYGEGGFYGLYAVGADSTGLSYGAFAKTDTTGPGYGVRAEANNTENGYGGYFEATDHVGVYAKGEDGGSRTVGDVELGGSWGVIAAQETWNSSMSLLSNDDVVVYLDNNDDDDSSCFSVYDPGDSPIVPIWEVCHTEPAASSIKTDDHGTQKLYASESPEPWVEDFGTATLVEGSTTVVIEPIYAQTVNLDDYHVFLTPLGDCNGLFVEAKGPTSFDVGELAGGTSNVSFDYRIVARRSGSDSTAAQEVSP